MSGRVIVITSGKGGVGKTTTAVNLSAILAEKGYKVLLADLDLQSYATSYCDMYDDKLPCIYEVMCEDNPVTAEDAVRPTGIERLGLLPSNYRFRKMETVLMMNFR
jgi:chromosome partitioning protein